MSLAWAFFSCSEGVGLVSLLFVVDGTSESVAALVLFLPRRCLTLLSAIVGYDLMQWEYCIKTIRCSMLSAAALLMQQLLTNLKISGIRKSRSFYLLIIISPLLHFSHECLGCTVYRFACPKPYCQRQAVVKEL